MNQRVIKVYLSPQCSKTDSELFEAVDHLFDTIRETTCISVQNIDERKYDIDFTMGHLGADSWEKELEAIQKVVQKFPNTNNVRIHIDFNWDKQR